MNWIYCFVYGLIQLHLNAGASYSRSLTETLSYFETLNKNDITHRITRRSISETHICHIAFKSHGEKFDVELIPSHKIFSPSFEAISIDKDGNEHPFYVDKDTFYKGHLKNHEYSSAVVHVEDGMVTATINTNNATFVIEPMWRHVDKNPSHDMIIYKVSDIHWNLTHANETKTCGTHYNRFSHHDVQKDIFHQGRSKRAVTSMHKNICSLTLVGDYTFFRTIGGGKIPLAVNYMLQVIARVNNIYKNTDWPGVGRNIGFQVQKTIIHESFSSDQKHLYNKEKAGPWNVDALLTEFSREKWSATCLAHLFTHQDFDRGVIGLAYVGSPLSEQVGGICTPTHADLIGLRYLNCGLTSGTNWGRRLLTTEADLVTAHELGHNFGANHDPASCSKSSGGKYIMYATSVSGDQPNNFKFSPCSKHQIAEVLKAKKNNCFTDPVDSYCGNYVVEEGEDCDPGITKDKCCTSSCTFQKNAQCSDSNHGCCTNCMFSNNQKLCRGEFKLECIGETKCTGHSKDCPEAPKLTNRVDCGLSKGNCVNGNCTSLCAQSNKLSCLCQAGGDACKICCKDTEKSDCKPLVKNGRETKENDGIPCFLAQGQGQCVRGICKTSQQNVKDEFKDLLKDFTFSKFARFMEANIVGTILVFSLMIWIPASCVVNYLDKKQEEEDKEMTKWLNPFSRQLMKTTPAKFKALFQKGRAQKPLRTQYHISS